MTNHATPADYARSLRELTADDLAAEYARAKSAYVASVQSGHSALTLSIAGRAMEIAAGEIGRRRMTTTEEG